MSRVIRRQFKICLIGSGYVGKTSIRRKYLDKTFKSNYIPTLGVDFAQKSIEHEGVVTNLVIWDIAGQPLYQNLRKRYYEGASGLILAYSVIDRDSFDDASKWLVEAHRFMGKLPPLIIVGNKIDLRETILQENPITREEGQAFADMFSEKLGMPTIFIETSAMSGENINEAFHTLTAMMVEKVTKKIPPVQPKIYIPGSTQPTDATEALIRETEQIVSTVKSIPTASTIVVESAMKPVSSGDEGTSATLDEQIFHEKDMPREPMSELGTLRGDLKRVQKERDDTILEHDTILLKLRNEIQVKKIMHEQLKQQLNLTKSEWTVAYDKYMEIAKSKKEVLEKLDREIGGITEKINKFGETI